MKMNDCEKYITSNDIKEYGEIERIIEIDEFNHTVILGDVKISLREYPAIGSVIKWYYALMNRVNQRWYRRNGPVMIDYSGGIYKLSYGGTYNIHTIQWKLKETYELTLDSASRARCGNFICDSIMMDCNISDEKPVEELSSYIEEVRDLGELYNPDGMLSLDIVDSVVKTNWDSIKEFGRLGGYSLHKVGLKVENKIINHLDYIFKGGELNTVSIRISHCGGRNIDLYTDYNRCGLLELTDDIRNSVIEALLELNICTDCDIFQMMI